MATRKCRVHTRGSHHATSLLMALALQAHAAIAAADPPDAKAESDQLFYEGNRLMAQGDVAEACERFERSLLLLRRGGTLLNLALCREAAGGIGVAAQLFQEA